MAKKTAAQKKPVVKKAKKTAKAPAKAKKAASAKAKAKAKARPKARVEVKAKAKAKVKITPKAKAKVKLKAKVKAKTAPKAKVKAKAVKPAARKAASKQVASKKPQAKKTPARKAAPAKKAAPARKAAPVKTAAPVKQAAPAKPTAPVRTVAPAAPARKVPSLDRERRVVRESDLVPTPPSSLVPQRHASAASTGADELRVKLANHTSTGPELTGGDVDADWQLAETSGDGAPGGNNPTPDQDVVEEIGKALGVQYDDDEELRGGEEIAERDRDRWELDPASSEDFEDR